MSKRVKPKKPNRKKTFILVSALIIVFAFLAWFSVADNTADSVKSSVQSESGLALGEVTFLKSGAGKDVTVLVEIAEDDYSRARGLMYRENIPENQGMLFIFEKDEYQSFWMKNTPTALDIIYVNSDLEIVTIAKDTKPFTTYSVPSTKPAKYVVEVVAGFTDRNGIAEGDRIRWKRI